MRVNEEIEHIRRELRGLERNVAQLNQRLDVVEAFQRRTDSAEDTGMPPVFETPPEFGSKLHGAVETVQAPSGESDRAPAAKMGSSPPPLPVKPKTAPVAAKAATPPKTPAPAPRPLLEGIKQAAPKVKKPRRFGPPEDMSFEMALGSYWLPRIGMLLVAIGVVWGFTYVAQQYKDSPLIPYARVGLGYLLALGLLGVGRKLESKYTNYARILMGGGLGLTYFVTFATWYIPGTRISPSQEITLMALAMLVVGWGALAQWRKSQPIAFTMTLLGHFTVALSTLSLDFPSRAAVGGLLLLGIGSAWFLIRNGWYAVAMTAMLGSYLNQFFWLSKSPGSDAPADFVVGMAILIAYVLTYALAEFLTLPERRTVPPRIRNLFITLNTTGFVLLGLGLVRAFPFARPHEHLLYFGTALFTLAMGLSYLYRFGKDRAATMYITKTSVLVTVGFATWLDGSTLTLSLALQALVLLVTARYAREHAGRILSVGVAVVAAVHGLWSFDNIPFPARGEAGFGGDVAVALAVVSVLFVLAELYRVTPWHTFAFNPFPKGSAFNGLCAELEMHPDGYAGGPNESRQTIAHGYALLGVALLVGYSMVLLEPGGTLLALGLGMLLLVAVALFRASAPLLTATAFLALVDAWTFFDCLHDTPAVSTAALAAGAVGPLFILSELLALFVPWRFAPFARHDDIQGAWLRNHQVMAMACAALAAVLTMALGDDRLPVEQTILLSGAMALTGVAYAAAGGSVNMGLAGLLLGLFGGIYGVNATGAMVHPWMALVGLGLTAVAATAVESRWWGKRPGLALHHLLPVPYFVYGAVAWGGFWLIDLWFEIPVRSVVLVAFAATFGVALPWLHRRAMAVFGTVLMALALVAWWDYWVPETPSPWFHGAFVALVAAALGGDRLLARFRPFANPFLGRVLLVIAWLAGYHYNAELNDTLLYYVGLAALSAAFLVYGAAFRTRTAVGLSLASGAIATVPLLLMPLASTSTGMILGAYLSVIGFWFATERGATIVLERARVELVPGHLPLLNALLVGIPTALGLVGLTHIDAIHDFYLTISWTVWALLIFVWALTMRQPWFRYAALGTIGLATGRAFLVDVWKLEGLYRVGAMIFLGLALLGVAYGYTRWRAMEMAAEKNGSNGEVDGVD